MAKLYIVFAVCQAQFHACQVLLLFPLLREETKARGLRDSAVSPCKCVWLQSVPYQVVTRCLFRQMVVI